MSMFDAPSSGATLKPADVKDHLLIVEPLAYETGIVTAFGESDAVRVTVHDVTAGETTENVLWFSGALVGALKGSIGKKILGVMGQGAAKAGQSPPWILVDASKDQRFVDAATAYLTGQVAASISAPAAPAAAAPVAQQSELDAALANLSAAGLTK